MKKILVVLLALVAFGTFAFAEDAKPVLTFGTYTDVVTELTSAAFTGSVYMENYINYAGKDVGVSMTLNAASNYAAADDTMASYDFFAEPRNFAVYYNMFDNMVSLKAGKLREGPARLGSYIDGNGFSTRLANVKQGLLLTLKPIAGLTAAAFIPATGAASMGDFAKSNFGVQYNLSGIANFVAGYRLENSEVYAGADVKALEGITVKAGYKMILTTGGASTIYVTAGMAPVENLDVGLDANVVLGSALGYGVQVNAAYTIDTYTVGAKVWYDNGSDAWYKNGNVKVNPYAIMNFSVGDIKVGASYNVGNSSWAVPIECELYF